MSAAAIVRIPMPAEQAWTLHLGDCLDVLKRLPDASVASVVTDPPAGIGFMGKDWDDYRRTHNPADVGRANVFGRTSRVAPEVGRARDGFTAMLYPIMCECLRVLKPGGHAIVWALPRTSHWTATAVEDAGFEIRDVIHHIFGSGFPKGQDVGKAIDKQAGAEREVIGKSARHGGGINRVYGAGMGDGVVPDITVPATPEAAQWDGWNTALKPAAENWIIARKPLSEPTVAANVLRHGTGAINVDGCRVAGVVQAGAGTLGGDQGSEDGHYEKGTGREYQSSGRWPANLCLSHVLPDEHGEGGCRRVGDRKVKASNQPGPRNDSGDARAWSEDGGWLVQAGGAKARLQEIAPNGTETVAAYECAEGCPVALLDDQSGERPVIGTAKSGKAHQQRGLGYMGSEATTEAWLPCDRGGASRYFNTFEPDPLDDVAPFFYAAKASRRERDSHLQGNAPAGGGDGVASAALRNSHPT